MNAHLNNWIGIDLGTYNSSAAVKSKDGSIELVRDMSRRPLINGSSLAIEERGKEFPSFISFNDDGTIGEVGAGGKEKTFVDPEFVVWGIKRLLGKTFTALKESGELKRYPFRIKPDRDNGQCLMVMNDKTYTPVQLCAEIFSKIKTEAEHHVDNTIESVVVSVPAYYDPIRVTPIVEAARSAGFTNIRTLPEPVAAALALEIDITVKPLKTIVFDLGAGTLDVTAGYLYRQPDQQTDFRFQVVKNTGDPKLGGIDMDDRLVRHIKNTCEITNLSVNDEARIRRVAEMAKIRLSQETEIDENFDLDGKKYTFSLNQFDLTKLLEGSRPEKNILDDCRCQVMAAIDEAGWSTQDIEVIIPIGGPTKLPCIHEMLKVVFYSNPNILIQLEEFFSGTERVDRMTAVSYGAVLSVDRKVEDIVPYGHGIEDLEIKEEEMIFTPNILVPRDSIYPFLSTPHWIKWTNVNGLYEIKIVQHIPASESGKGDSEYRFVGMLNFAVKNPRNCMVVVQMGYNTNKELVVSLANVLSNEEHVQYIGINNHACINMKYPLVVKRMYSDVSNIENEPPSAETIDRFTDWCRVVVGFIQKKVDHYPISQMLVQQILDEINLLLKKEDRLAAYVQLCNTIDTLVWNSSSKGLIDKKEYNELINRLSAFKRELFRIRVAQTN